MSDPVAPPPADPAVRLQTFALKNRLLAAVIVLLAFEAMPIIGLGIMISEGSKAGTALAALFAAAAAGPAVGLLLQKRWAYVIATYLGWANVVGAVLSFFRFGFHPLVYLLGAVAAALVVSVNLSRPRSPAPAGAAPESAAGAPPRPPEPMETWVRENVEAIVVAFIMALVIRCFCIEVFKIPSSSMEPTLLGDAWEKHDMRNCAFESYHRAAAGRRETVGGDRIMVTKYFYAAAELERYDVVVFKFPLNQSRNFIKRVVGLPGEELRVYHGNLYVKRPGDERFRIARRTLRTQDSIWINPSKAGPFLDSPEVFKNTWTQELPSESATAEVSAGELATLERAGRRDAAFRYSHPILDQDGWGTDVPDLRLSFEVEASSEGGEVFAEIANDYGRFDLVLSASGQSVLRHFASAAAAAQPSKSEPLRSRLRPERARVELFVLDGAAYARIDGKVEARIDFIDAREDAKLVENVERAVRFGSRGATVRVRDLRLERDIHYKGKDGGVREDVPVKIPDDCFLVMGDNVNSSHDSRSWTKVVYELTDGRQVVSEGQAVGSPEVRARDLQDKYGLDVEPDVAVSADRYGQEWALYRSDPGPLPKGAPAGVIARELPGVPNPFIEMKFLVGKALWTWWPQGRWFRLIR